MARLPGYFCDLYLEAHNDVHRLSGTAVDLAHLVDATGDATDALELRGLVVRCCNPKALADAVGPVAASVVPAALDELLRRDDADRDSYFLDPFAIFIVDAERSEIEQLLAPFAGLVRDALLDHFEGIGEEGGVPAAELGAALAAEVDELCAECRPALELCAVRFRFEACAVPRGERLLTYLFDVRPSCLEPGAWPGQIVL
jgi:hypothetical protein